MKSYNEFASVPDSGIIVVEEGSLVRVYFDITAWTPQPSPLDGEDYVAPDNQYVCENVDVCGREYGDVVSAIVNDRYSSDEVQAINANFIEAKDAQSDITDEKRAEYLSEYAAFQSWRKKAKTVAGAVIELLN